VSLLKIIYPENRREEDALHCFYLFICVCLLCSFIIYPVGEWSELLYQILIKGKGKKKIICKLDFDKLSRKEEI
jgi:hypothetical protein